MITPIRVLIVGGSFERVCVARDMKNWFLVNFVIRLFQVSNCFRIRRTACCDSGYMYCLSLRSFTLNFSPFHVKTDLRSQCAVRIWDLVIVSTAHCT